MPWKVALTWILPLLAALNWLIRLLKATPLAAPRPCQTVMSVTPLAFFRADASGTDDPVPPPLDVELQAAEPAMTVTAMAAAANLFFMTLPSDQSIGSVRRDRAVQRRTPRVRPLMRKRWAKTTRRIVGTTTRTAPAKMTAGLAASEAESWEIPTWMVRAAAVSVISSGQKKPFHAARALQITALVTWGRQAGMMIVNRARRSPAPSIRAASHISVGTAANACRSRKTGYPAARYGITTPRMVLRSPIELTSSYLGMTMLSAGIASVTRTRTKAIFRPRQRGNTRAYAASARS